jgi:hypothetical protein
MKTLRFLGLILIILTTGLMMTACSKQKVEAEPVDAADAMIHAGEYELVSVDGKEVPATVSHSGTDIQVLSGAFTIDADGQCTSRTVFVPPNGQEIEREVDATYTMEGSVLTMKWEGAGFTVGQVEGDTFTMNNEGMEFVYRKKNP